MKSSSVAPVSLERDDNQTRKRAQGWQTKCWTRHNSSLFSGCRGPMTREGWRGSQGTQNDQATNSAIINSFPGHLLKTLFPSPLSRRERKRGREGERETSQTWRATYQSPPLPLPGRMKNRGPSVSDQYWLGVKMWSFCINAHLRARFCQGPPVEMNVFISSIRKIWSPARYSPPRQKRCTALTGM